ncbi:MAG: PaaI family thioesterase [Azoarcus sp.]|nr:PaaI family thioesterase [Azoarcus sp.]
MQTMADPGFAGRVRASFERQNAMRLIRASLSAIGRGRVEIHLPYWSDITQQHGFVHGGIVGMIADSAAGYAAMTVAPEDTSVLTVEFKMNLLAPANGEALVAKGEVVRPGRTLIVTKAEVFALRNGKERLCALMQQTIMVMPGKEEKASSQEQAWPGCETD